MLLEWSQPPVQEFSLPLSRELLHPRARLLRTPLAEERLALGETMMSVALGPVSAALLCSVFIPSIPDLVVEARARFRNNAGLEI